jgi:hypothetical protein
MLVPSLLLFATAYMLLRERPKSANPKPRPPPPSEQVLTTNIRNRMADAIGTGKELGVSRGQMNHTQRDTEADIHVGGSLLKPMPPPPLPHRGGQLSTKPKDAPGFAIAVPRLDAAKGHDDLAADKAARGDKLMRNIQRHYTHYASPAKDKDLARSRVVLEPWMTSMPGVTRTVRGAPPVVDALPAAALTLDATVRAMQMETVSAEPGDAVKAAALASA